MAFVNLAEGRRDVPYNYKSYVCDSVADVDDLPVDISAGSIAIAIAEAKKFMLNNQGEWLEIPFGSSAGGGVSPDDIAALAEVLSYIEAVE